MKQSQMNSVSLRTDVRSRAEYDVNLGNVQKWRDESPLKPWTAQRTKMWTEMRAKGVRPRRPFDLYRALCIWSERLFIMFVAGASVGVAWVVFSIAYALFSGRIQQLLEAMKASSNQ